MCETLTDAGRPFQGDVKLHVAGVPIDGSVRPRAVDDDGGIGDVPGLQTCQAAVAGDFVLEDELEHEIAVQRQALLDERPHQPQADGDARLVVHGTATENRVAGGVDVAGERRMGPFTGIACRLGVEMAVQNEGAASAPSGQADDDIVAARHLADGLRRIGVAA